MKQNLLTKCWNNTLRRIISQKGLKRQNTVMIYDSKVNSRVNIRKIFLVDDVMDTTVCAWGYCIDTVSSLFLGKLSVKRSMWSSPHGPQHLKEDQILSVQNWDDNEEDGHQKAEEENHGLDDHACRRKIRAAGIQSVKLHSKHSKQNHTTTPSPMGLMSRQYFSWNYPKHIMKPTKSTLLARKSI